MNVSVTGAPHSNMMNRNNVAQPHKQLMKFITNSPRSKWLFVACDFRYLIPKYIKLANPKSVGNNQKTRTSSKFAISFSVRAAIRLPFYLLFLPIYKCLNAINSYGGSCRYNHKHTSGTDCFYVDFNTNNCICT